MPHPRRIILILAVVLAINGLLPRPYAFSLGNTLQPLVLMLVAPGQPLHETMARLRADSETLNRQLEFEGFGDAELQDRLALALAELEQLRLQNQRLTERFDELLPVIDLLAERGLDAFRQLSARVTPGNAPGLITIAAGSEDGIAPGQSVVYIDQIVGQIVEPVTDRSANVALLTRVTPRLRVAVAPPANATFNRPTLDVRIRFDADANAFIAEDLPATLAVEPGDVVRLNDELSYVHAQGFQVGRVTRAEPLPSDPLSLQRIVVEPSVDLTRLPRVTVLIPPAEVSTGPPSASEAHP